MQRKHLEQTILPTILDVEDREPFFHQDSIDFTQRLKRSLEDSRELQRNLEAQRRKSMKSGKEKSRIIYSPEEEVVKVLLIFVFLLNNSLEFKKHKCVINAASSLQWGLNRSK